MLKKLFTQKINPTMLLVWVVVAFASAIITWLILMGDDAQIYRNSPSSHIPAPTAAKSVDQPNNLQKIEASQLQQNTVAVNVPEGSHTMGIIVTNLGLQQDLTQHAMANLPAYVTLSFSPYTHNKDELIAQALKNHHESLIDIPITLTGDEVCDGGPCAIDASMSADENYKKIRRIMNAAKGCIGLNCFDKHQQTQQILSDLIPQLKNDPFLVVAQLTKNDALPSSVIIPLAFHEDATEEILNEQLDLAEKSLLTNAKPVLIGKATPILIETLQKWSAGLAAKNIHIVPLSACKNCT